MFVDSENKRAIREQWNLPLLKRVQSGLGRTLAYLGLPGASVNDLIDWAEVLNVKTCVQVVRKSKDQLEEDLETISQMSHNILVRDIRRAEIIRGSVEDVILTGQGADGLSPKMTLKEPSGWRFQYDLYNLDFLGGVAYKKPKSNAGKGQKSHRINAIEQLFVRQRGQSFNLFLTINVRDTFGDEPVQFLMEHAKRTDSALLATVAGWGANLEQGLKQHQLRLWVPLWIRELAEMQNFRCRCLPAVAYVGHENAKMMHFVFEFEFMNDRELRVNSEQSLEDVLKLPMLTVVDGVFLYCVSPDNPCTINDPLSGPLGESVLRRLITPQPDQSISTNEEIGDSIVSL
jgi:hypothetical protein